MGALVHGIPKQAIQPMRDLLYIVLLRAQSRSSRDHLHGSLQQTAGPNAGLRLMTAADASNPRIAVFSVILGMGSDSERPQGWKEANHNLQPSSRPCLIS